ncbi:MAG: Xylose isomerase domain protein barrel [Sphingobacteriaceae bacterium]|jgi:sugar phosphate isomerase/epimerase|nr:Xylose isomerase domain protein barrel [Sphingobacteriaceae bacterium]
MSEKLTRREWNALALVGLGGLLVPSVFASCKTSSGVIPTRLIGTAAAKQAADLGVMLGTQTYSFRDRSLDDAIKAMVQLGVKSCELWDGHVEPRNLQWEAGQSPITAKTKAENIRKWRDTLDMSTIRAIKDKLDAAQISIVAYTSTIKDNTSDSDIDLMFRIAQNLGVDTINSSATVNVMKRIDPYAQKYKMRVAMHNHSHVENPNEISSPDSFSRGMEGLSDYININLDIGHFTAANFDAVDFLKNHHQKVLSIHVKDRKKNQGPNMPLGEGDTPIVEVLRLIRDNKWPIPANIEYEYKGANTFEEVKKCLDYCKKALA